MIRGYTTRDAEAAFQLAQQAPQAAQWSLLSYQQLLTAPALAWVAERDGRIVAFLVARNIAGEAEILNIVVDPAHRRQSLGRSLFGAAHAEFLRAGVSRVFLEVRENNRPALEFYQQLGFTATGLRPGYYHHPPESAVLMELKLAG